MSSFAVRFNVSSPVSCARSGASVYTGFCLNSPSLNMLISEEVYDRDFKTSHPQINQTLILSKIAVRSILSHSGATLPVGYLIGNKIEPLAGEILRYKCTDFILTPLISLKYQFATPQDKSKFDKANLSGNILGKFIGHAPMGGSKLERDAIASLSVGKVCLVVCGPNIGEQKVTIVKATNAFEIIGIFVE
ncbi:MAG: hypothetical protein FWH03_00700 [Firmicutes bacterium]|nr:hypothetical protein [Bacillota bacterium]